jgi:hypothetical protein
MPQAYYRSLINDPAMQIGIQYRFGFGGREMFMAQNDPGWEKVV